MKLLYSYMRRLCAYITDRLYQFKRFLQLSIDGLGHSCPVFTKVTGILPVALVCFQFVCFAQSSRLGGTTGIGEIKPLMVGQKVPEEFWTKEHLFYVNGDTVRRTLEEHRGKMLVLDFWMSGCMPCLLHQREINNFKAEYPDDLSVIMINSNKTREDFKKIDHFVQSERFKKIGLEGLVSIIEDGYLQEVFPYRSYPTYFWINKLGILQTQTFRNLLDRDYQAPFITKK